MSRYEAGDQLLTDGVLATGAQKKELSSVERAVSQQRISLLQMPSMMSGANRQKACHTRSPAVEARSGPEKTKGAASAAPFWETDGGRITAFRSV